MTFRISSGSEPLAVSVYDAVMSVESDFHAAARLLAVGDAPAAAARIRGAVSAGGLPPAREADARYLLGRALDECGDRDGMNPGGARCCGWTHRRPAAAAPGSVDEFEPVAEAALAELPQELLDG